MNSTISFSRSLKGTQVQDARRISRVQIDKAVTVQAVTTQRLKAKPSTGTKRLVSKPKAPTPAGGAGTLRIGGPQAKKLTSISLYGEKGFRPRLAAPPREAPRLLARVEQLKLLSKAEQAGLLSLAEKAGLTLTFIEQSGLLSKAESFGLLSAATDGNTPTALYAAALLLFAAGPALVALTPDTSPALVALQALGAIACIAGGSAAFGGASLVSTLQRSD